MQKFVVCLFVFLIVHLMLGQIFLKALLSVILLPSKFSCSSDRAPLLTEMSDAAD